MQDKIGHLNECVLSFSRSHTSSSFMWDNGERCPGNVISLTGLFFVLESGFHMIATMLQVWLKTIHHNYMET